MATVVIKGLIIPCIGTAPQQFNPITASTYTLVMICSDSHRPHTSHRPNCKHGRLKAMFGNNSWPDPLGGEKLRASVNLSVCLSVSRTVD